MIREKKKRERERETRRARVVPLLYSIECYTHLRRSKEKRRNEIKRSNPEFPSLYYIASHIIDGHIDSDRRSSTEGSEKRNDGVEICPEPIALRYRHGNLTTRWGTSGPTCIHIRIHGHTFPATAAAEWNRNQKEKETQGSNTSKENMVEWITWLIAPCNYNMTNTQSVVQKGCDPGRAPLSTDLANATSAVCQMKRWKSQHVSI